MTRFERESPCKINLLLNILGKRPDGFHELETVMHPVPVKDTLRFESSGTRGIELTCSHPWLPADSSNIVCKAAAAFFQVARIAEGVRIHLEKRVPLAAGLGGGSSNAAATLLGLNEMFGNPLDAAQLNSMAASLGSDVPFFLQTRPALATGRGETVEPLEPFPALAGAWLVLVHPGFGVSTAWAYQALAQFPEALHGRKGRAAALVEALQSVDVAKAAGLFYNTLEVPVLRKYPVLRLYQLFFRARGAATTLMSGSGSTTFALFREEGDAQAAIQPFKQEFGETCWLAVTPLG